MTLEWRSKPGQSQDALACHQFWRRGQGRHCFPPMWSPFRLARVASISSECSGAWHEGQIQTTAPGMRVAQYLVSGETDLGFQQVSELVHETGIDFLGPLPPDVQNVTVYSSGILTGSSASGPAKALQMLLSAPAAAPVIKKNGMEPSSP